MIIGMGDLMTTYLKRFLGGLLLATLLFFASIAQANFVGYYDVSNWTVEQNGFADGSVDTTGAPASILIIEPEAADEEFEEFCNEFPALCEEELSSEVTFTITAESDGIFSFDWVFDAREDNCCSGATVYNNGRSYLVFDDDDGWEPADTETGVDDVFAGSYSMSILAGDLIGFGVWSFDSCCGANELTISNFSVSPVPVPAAFWLFGTALVGFIGISRRRKVG